MIKTFSFLLSLMFLTSCSIYTSAGRKQFEEKAPTSLSLRAFSLQNCRELSTTETWVREEFPSSSHELIEIHPDYEVWGKTMDNGQMEITVFSKNDMNSSASTTESCTYQFESQVTWLTYKKSFLDELSRSLVRLD